MMTKLVAEIGWNHMGDMVLAKEMIAAAAESGADAVKFQVWSVKNLKSGPWDSDGRREIYEKAELSEEQLMSLREESLKLNLGFFVSIFSEAELPIAMKVSPEIIKVPSTEIANLALAKGIKDYNQKFDVFKHVIISTGASVLAEIKNAVQEQRLTQQITLLHCVSSYPCPPEKANLMRINSLQRQFCPNGVDVGYSGHCEGVIDAIVSTYFHPTIIEKHFTIDHGLPGRDNKFAILPADMKTLRSYINNAHSMLVQSSDMFDYQECEKEMRNLYRGRWNA